MGRTARNSSESAMTVYQVAQHIVACCESLHDFQVYMFGSSLRGTGTDFDILIIGPAGESLLQLKEEVRLAEQELPLDVLYMLPQEAEETQFVVREGCVPLSRLASFNAQ